MYSRYNEKTGMKKDNSTYLGLRRRLLGAPSGVFLALLSLTVQVIGLHSESESRVSRFSTL